jgi:urea transporter
MAQVAISRQLSAVSSEIRGVVAGEVREGWVVTIPVRVAWCVDVLLMSYSQLLFSRSRWVGALMLAATLVQPRLFLAGAGAVLLAGLVARSLGLAPELIRSGLFGYNALLVALGCAALLEPGLPAVGLGLAGVVAAVVLGAALQATLTARLGLPVLTLPFVLITWLLLVAAPGLGVGLQAFPGELSAVPAWMPAVLEQGLRALGTLLFVPHPLAGLVLLVALLWSSRIGAGVAVLAFLGAWLIGTAVPGSHPLMVWMLALNMAFVAIGLGGIWFVPGLSSLAMAGAGAILAALLSIAGQDAMGGLGLLVLPLNLTLVIVLCAMRLRVRDGAPKSVDFVPGSPEENLAYYRTRVARFGARYLQRFRAPYLGAWTCTQGNDGAHTHQGPWRHGLDFEVLDAEGRKHRGRGERPQDYHCWHLPVLATADGTVVEVVDGLPDSPVGQPDLEERWGNVVVIHHGPGLYSLVAHLSRGSVKVKPGQRVKQGEPLGLCGSSGRSPVPHLHFQLQATPRVGSPTIPVELHDVIGAGEHRDRLFGACVPEEGQRLRNADADSAMAAMLRFEPGETLALWHEGPGASRMERVVPELDLLGNQLLRSQSGASLAFRRLDGVFTSYEVLGSRDTGLHLLRAALPRVPLEAGEELVWSDVVPASPLVPWHVAPGLHLRALLRSHGCLDLDYRVLKRGDAIEVRGTSRAQQGGQPALRTRAVLRRGRGLQSVQVSCCGRTRRLLRYDNEHLGADGARREPR